MPTPLGVGLYKAISNLGFSPIVISYLVGLKPIATIVALSNPPAKAGGNSWEAPPQPRSAELTSKPKVGAKESKGQRPASIRIGHRPETMASENPPLTSRPA